MNLKKAFIEKLVGEPITEFSSNLGAEKGDNVGGSLLSLKVTTTSGKKLNLVYKGFPTSELQSVQCIVQYRIENFCIFRTETCMYEKVFPRLKDLAKLRNLSNKELPIANYISGFNDDQNDYLCLEDLRPKGYIMQDKFNSLTLAEVSLVMTEMARFHALTYFMIRNDGERIFEEDDGLHRLKYSMFIEEPVKMEKMGTETFYNYMENTIQLLEDRDKSLAQHIQNFLKKHTPLSFYAITRFNITRTDKDCFPCLIHGDLWTNNLLFKYEIPGDRETPIQLKFIDFQLSRRGNIFEDLGYFFWTSTTPEFRKFHLEQMLSVYTKSFEDTMDQINFPKPVGFSRGYVIDKFYQGMLATYSYMPFAISLQLGDLSSVMQPPKEYRNGDELEMTTEGNANASEFENNMKEDKKLMLLRMRNSPRALERLENLTREAVELRLL